LIAVPFAIICGALTLLSIVLLLGAIVRLARTPRSHPDRGARWNTARLLAIVSVALGLSVIRTQFLSTSRPFLILSVALVPFGIAALWLTVQLVRTYRSEKERPSDQTLPDLEAVQSRISPPSMERNNDDSRRNTGS
jgi:hypothetical protein